MLRVERFPYSIRGLPYAISLDQLPRHHREHVIVFVDVLESFPANLPSIVSATKSFFPIKRRQAVCMVAS
jgi:hypothetical protein